MVVVKTLNLNVSDKGITQALLEMQLQLCLEKSSKFC